MSRQTLLLASIDDGLLGLLPVLFRTDVLLAVHLVAQRNLCLKLLEVESLEDDHDDVDDLQELLLHLVGTAEEVCIVLCERTHAGQAVKLARLLVAIDGAELCQTKRQIAIRARRSLVDLAVVRAVHWLEHVELTFLRCSNGLEGILAILCPVARSHIEVLVADMWGDDLHVSVTLLDLRKVLLQTHTKGSSLRQPKGKTLAYVL